MSDEIRPLPFDPAAKQVMAMFDLNDAEWLYAAEGDYQSACVEVMKRDGTNFQTCIAIEYPVVVRNTNEAKTLRLLLNPEDAQGLAEVLTQSVNWLEIARKLGN